MQKLHLQEFIKSHPNWRTELTEKPYNIRIKDYDYITVFTYNINADFSIPLCREARGLMLYNDSPVVCEDLQWTVACQKFNKFFNFQQLEADSIDWSSAKILEKVDGSIVAAWFDLIAERWRFATNNVPFAELASIDGMSLSGVKNFNDLIIKAISATGIPNLFSYLDCHVVYIFELVSPYTRIVVHYPTEKLYFLSERNLFTEKEQNRNEELLKYFDKPIEYSALNLADCKNIVKEFNYEQEGLVVCDKDYHRIKIKSEDYLRVFKIRGEAGFNEERALELVLNDQQDDASSLFPEYKKIIDKVEELYFELVSDLRVDLYHYIDDWMIDTVDRKTFAVEFANKTIYPQLFYALKDGKCTVSDWTDFLKKTRIDKLWNLMTRKEEK